MSAGDESGRAGSDAGPGDALVFAGRRLLTVESERGHRPARLDELGEAAPVEAIDVAGAEGTHLRAVDLGADFEAPAGIGAVTLRRLWVDGPRSLYRHSGRALQLLEWRATHRHCGRCGGPTEDDAEHASLTCSACGQMHFPRVAPATITLIEDGPRMLLGRTPAFPPGVYSTLAGFVEPGESLEECVRREVLEEAGVRLGDVRYFSSQPWPFPHSLMIGFVASWEAGEAAARDGELEDLRWFGPGDPLPVLPPPMSIARALIEDFLERWGREHETRPPEPDPDAYRRA